MQRNLEPVPAGAGFFWLTLPNALSLLRLLLGCVFFWVPAAVRVPVVIVAAVTDMLDGAVGRHSHTCSQLGRILDPIADKVFVLAVVLTLIGDGTLHPGEVLLIGVRDIVVLVGTGWLLFRQGGEVLERLAPVWLGKATTAAQFCFLLGAVAAGRSITSVLIPTAILSALAALDHIRRFLWPPANTPGSVEQAGQRASGCAALGSGHS